ncbi:MAG: alginate O-acetyltransferase AlgX-related protein [Planctomycetota bacterium]
MNPAWALPVGMMCVAIAGCLCQHILTWGKGNRSGQPVHGWSTFRMLFQLLVLGWLAFLAFTEAFSVFRVSSAIGLTVGLFACGLLLRPLATRPLLRRGVRAADVVLMNLCLIVVGLELGMRLVSAISPTPILARTQQDTVDTINTYRYQPNDVRYGFPCNRGGHYDTEFKPKQEGRPLILAIGDSFSAGIVPHYFHFTTTVERELPGVDVYNMGIPGTDPPEYLHLWRTEGQQLKPDLLIINLFVGNDLQGCWSEKVDHPRLRSWFDRSQVFVFFVPERLKKIAAENKRLAALGKKAGESQGEQGQIIVKDNVGILLAAFPWMADPTLEEPGFSEQEFISTEAARAFDVLLEEQLDYYEALFDVLTEIQWAARGTPLMVVMIPDEFQVNDELWEKVLTHMKQEDLDRFKPQRRISNWLREQGIPCLDLLPPFRAVPPLADGRRHLYHLRDTHFNAHGNHVAGKAIADFIRKHFAKVLR